MSGIASDCDNVEIMSYVSSRLGSGCFRSFNGISKDWKQILCQFLRVMCLQETLQKPYYILIVILI